MTAMGTGQTAPDGAATEDLTVRPIRMRIYAATAAAVLIIAFAIFGALLKIEDTGVYYRTADQVAVGLIGVFLACGPLLLLRPRMRVGAFGVAVRNVFSEHVYEWEMVRSLDFPEGAAWARLELAGDEYMPVLAVQINDRMHAVDAVRAFRARAERYGLGPAADAEADAAGPADSGDAKPQDPQTDP